MKARITFTEDGEQCYFCGQPWKSNREIYIDEKERTFCDVVCLRGTVPDVELVPDFD